MTTRIEAAAIVPADAAAVWEALLDQARWANWSDPVARVRLDGVCTGETFARVGDRRRCEAVLTGLPLVRERRFSWDEQVTDVDDRRTFEVESLASGSIIRRWRVRFWLVAQAEQETRIRCDASYSAVSVGGWLADRLFLRSRATAAIESWLGSFADSFRTEELAEPVIFAGSPSDSRDHMPTAGAIAA